MSWTYPSGSGSIDPIPAVVGVTSEPFPVVTANAFAILGVREQSPFRVAMPEDLAAATSVWRRSPVPARIK